MGRSGTEEVVNQFTPVGGDSQHKAPGHIRVAALNLSGLPVDATDPKYQDLWETVRRHHVDIALLTEVGINWSKVPRHMHLHELVQKNIPQSRTTTSHNRHNATRVRQWGGTAIMIQGSTRGRILSSTSDTHNWGRWTSILLQGKGGIKVRLVSTYVANKSTKTPGTVYNQLAANAAAEGIDADPISLHMQELQQQVHLWCQAGETVILGGDINMDVRASKMSTMLSEEGLHEVFSSQHQTPTATQIRNRNNMQIDGIWTSQEATATQSGATPYGCWDHRMIWADFSATHLLGQGNTPTQPFRGRRLQLQSPTTVNRYLEEYAKAAQQLRLLERAMALEQSISDQPLTAHQSATIERIDADRTKAMLRAERGCRKVRMRKVPYSPLVARIQKAHKFWTESIRRRQGHKVKGSTIDRLKKQAQLCQVRTKGMSIAGMTMERNRMWKQLKQEKKMAAQHRVDFLQSNAEFVEHSGGNPEKYKRQLVEREETRARFRRIKHALAGSALDSQVTMVVHDGPGGDGRVLTEPEEVAKACCETNIAKYQAAWSSDLCVGRVSRKVGRYGTSPAADAIIEGLVPSQVRTGTAELLHALRRSPQATPWAPMDTVISTEDHVEGWRKIKERTSSGPSGIHFGCWKANTKDPQLAAIDAIMRSIPYRTGYSLSRWQQCTDVQLCKQPGNLSVTKTRTIGLMEGDFNMNTRQLGRTARRHAEANSTIAAEQYGSCQMHTAQEVLVNVCLTDDIMRISGRDAAVCSNDAKGCYDRISHPAFGMALRRQGTPRQPIDSVLCTLQNMRHRISMGSWVSLTSYSGTHLPRPIQGLVQGLGVAPTGWLLISLALIERMQAKGFGFTYGETADAMQRLVCFAYVDDTNLVHTLRSRDIPSQCREFQSVVSQWESMLTASGGCLAPEKSFWQLVRFKWSNS